MGPASTIVVASRVIDIDGEAYFLIAPHAARPMVIRTRDVAIRVLGTRFSVRHYATDRGSRVVVDDGKVSLQPLKVSPPRALTIVTAHMAALVTDSAVTPSTSSADQYAAWTQGRLVFDGTPLSDVVRDVTRMYGVEVRVTDSTLASQPLTMTVSTATEPLAQVLEIISFAQHAHVVRDGNVLVLSPGRTVRHPAVKTFPQPDKHYGL
jgi:ferric-dicitrate binding protein FerR (iron transport regulator)